MAENCAKILTKGRKICVSGSIQTRQYDGQDGTKRTAFDIVADEVEFLSSGNRTDDGAPQETERRQQVNNSGLTPVEEELPF